MYMDIFVDISFTRDRALAYFLTITTLLFDYRPSSVDRKRSSAGAAAS
jgi:hypothetical protein